MALAPLDDHDRMAPTSHAPIRARPAAPVPPADRGRLSLDLARDAATPRG